MDFKDKVLQLIRTRGPVLPSQINKEIEQNVLFTSAILSELVDSKQLRLSHTKIGGSPVYYLPGQESRLEFLYKQLHEKEQKAFYRWTIEWPSFEKGYEGRPERRRGVDVLHFQDGKIIKKLTYSKTTIEIDRERLGLRVSNQW